MKKIIKILYTGAFALLAFYAFQRSGYSQTLHQSTSFDLNSTVTGNNVYEGRDYVKLLPGFHYTSSGSNKLDARINYSMDPQNALYTQVSDDDNNLDLSLPVGSLPGSIDVSASGAATYTIPIFTPPGTASMQPSIYVSYSSNGGEGLLGTKWNLGGLSTISRVGQNYFYNNNTTAVNGTSTDRFSLDGNLLVVTNGNYGDYNSTYATETETYDLITFNSISQVYSYFEVKTKDGNTIEYGKTSDSRLSDANFNVFKWNINKITDQNGNYINYHYTIYQGETVIDYIEYTGNAVAGISPYNTIKFQYDIKQDKNIQFIAGYEIPKSLVLSKITVNCENSIVREYYFQYTLEKNQFVNDVNDSIFSSTRLYKIYEEGRDGIKYNPTRIKWGAVVVNPFSQTLNTLTGDNDFASNTNSYQSISGDFNNDGKSDLLIAIPHTDATYHWKWILYTAKAHGQDGFDYVASGDMANYFVKMFPVDRDNDGITEVYFETIPEDFDRVENSFPDEENPTFQLYKFASSTLQYQASYDHTITSPPATLELYAPADILEADFLGNGKHQYLFTDNEGFLVDFIDDDAIITMSKLTSHGQNGIVRIEMLFDFNGNGKSDFLIRESGQTNIHEYDNNTAEFVTIASTTYPYIYAYEQDANQYKLGYLGKTYAGDFNGDGNTDFLIADQNEDLQIEWKLYYSNGKTFSDPILLSLPYSSDEYLDGANVCVEDEGTSCIVADFNGDGKSEILFKYVTHQCNGPHQLPVYPPPAQGNQDLPYRYRLCYPETYYKDAVSGNHFTSYNCPYFFDFVETYKFIGCTNLGDFNGDGKLDLIVQGDGNYGTDSRQFTTILMHSADTSNMVSKITDGLNKYCKFKFHTLARDPNYTIFDHTTYPTVEFSGPIYVVDNLVVPDGIGGESTTNYTFKDARLNLMGLGLIGFTEFYKVQNNIQTRMHFANTFTASAQLGRIRHFIKSADSTEVKNLSNSYFVMKSVSTPSYYLRNSYYSIYPYQSYIKTTNYLKGVWRETSNTVESSTGNTLTADTAYYSIGSTNTEATSHSAYTYTSFTNWQVASLLESATITLGRTGESSFSRWIDYTYNGTGNLTSKITDDGNYQSVTTTYSNFTNCGQSQTATVSAVDIGSPRVNSVAYDSKCRFITSVTDPLSQTASRTFDPAFGTVLTETAIDGLITTYEYDGFGNANKITSPNSISTTSAQSWVTGGSPTNAVYSSLTQASGSPTVQQWFDVYDRAIQTESDGFDGKVSSNKTYNTKGQLSQQSEPHYSSETVRWTTYTYDDYSRLTASAYNSLSPTTYSYNGKVTTITNPEGNSTIQTIDAAGLVVASQDNAGEVDYTYFSSGKIKSTTALDAEIYYYYDDYGRLCGQDDPDAGHLSYTYNSLGELTSQKIGDLTTTFAYDAGGRLYTKTDNDNNVTTYNFVSSSNGKGKLYSTTGPGNYSSYNTYNALGLLVQNVETEADSKQFTTSYTYDNFGVLIGMTYPSGFGITYAYDNNGHQIMIYRADNGDRISGVGSMSAIGNPKTINLGNGGLQTVYTYDNYDNISRIWTGTTNPTVQDMLFSFTALSGNLASRTDQLRSINETFNYDNMDRLTSSSKESLTISYTRNGNIDSKSDAASTYVYDATKVHAVADLSGYAHGSLEREQDIYYNAVNKTDSIFEDGQGAVKFTYAPDEMRRIMKTYNVQKALTKTTYYMPGYEEEVVGGSTTKQISYISGVNGLTAVAIYNGSNTTLYYVCKDHLGSITALLNTNGTVAEEYSYDAWGRRRNPTDWTYTNVSNPTKLNRGYTGHEHLDQFVLINMNGRMYDPQLGRMLSPDKFVKNGMATQDYNKYSYCNNNPLKYTDPSGYLYYGQGSSGGSMSGNNVTGLWMVPALARDNTGWLESAGDFIFLNDPFFKFCDRSGGGGGGGFGGILDIATVLSILYPSIGSVLNSNSDEVPAWTQKADGEFDAWNNCTSKADQLKMITTYLNYAGKQGMDPKTTEWCASFLFYVIENCGAGLKGPSYPAGVDSWAQWGQSTANNGPEIGAIVLMSNKGIRFHSGIVTDYEAGVITVLAGCQGGAITYQTYATNNPYVQYEYRIPFGYINY